MSYRIHINQFIREKITFMLFNSKNGNMKKKLLEMLPFNHIETQFCKTNLYSLE